MMELEDKSDLKSDGSNAVPVRIRLPAPTSAVDIKQRTEVVAILSIIKASLEQMPFRKTLFVVARLLLSLKAEHDIVKKSKHRDEHEHNMLTTLEVTQKVTRVEYESAP